jgi:hypothetical protein
MTIAISRPRLTGLPHFYFAIAFVATTVAFWPSFFSRLRTTDAAHLLHGLTATLWMVMPVVQSWLISRRKFKLHRRLGWMTLLVIAPTLVVSGLHAVQLMIERYDSIHAIRLLKFTFLDISAMALFVIFLGLAIRSIQRKNIDDHARYMAGTVLFALEPALERVFVFFVPGVSGFAEAVYYALIAMEVILGALLLSEWRNGKIRPPFVVALAFFILIHVSMTPIASSPYFLAFAHWFAAI